MASTETPPSTKAQKKRAAKKRASVKRAAAAAGGEGTPDVEAAPAPVDEETLATAAAGGGATPESGKMTKAQKKRAQKKRASLRAAAAATATENGSVADLQPSSTARDLAEAARLAERTANARALAGLERASRASPTLADSVVERERAEAEAQLLANLAEDEAQLEDALRHVHAPREPPRAAPREPPHAAPRATPRDDDRIDDDRIGDVVATLRAAAEAELVSERTPAPSPSTPPRTGERHHATTPHQTTPRRSLTFSPDPADASESAAAASGDDARADPANRSESDAAAASDARADPANPSESGAAAASDVARPTNPSESDAAAASDGAVPATPSSSSGEPRGDVHAAARDGDVEEVRRLGRRHAEARDERGMLPIHAAAQRGRVAVLECLATELGADLDGRDAWRKTCVHYCAVNGHVDALRALARLGADPRAVDGDGLTPLHGAVTLGQVAVIECLINEFGADPNHRTEQGVALTHLAADSGRLDVLRMLVVDVGVDVDSKDARGWTAAHYAALADEPDDLEFLAAELGADPNSRDVDGWSVAHVAAFYGHLRPLKVLANLGSSLTTRDGNGDAPLDIAEEQDNVDVAEWLRTHVA